MNNKLSLSDIAALLSERTGKDKKATEQFLREFIQVVSAGLFTDKIVKVKGLGTFKIIPVEERESVHVNTGERFIIPAHYKYSFLPDKELRDTVNAPFAFFETTEIGNDVDFSDLEESEENEAAVEDESVEEVLPEGALNAGETIPILEEEVTEAALSGDEPYSGSLVKEEVPETASCDAKLQSETVTVVPDNEEENEAVSPPTVALPEENPFAGKDTFEETAAASSDANPQFPDTKNAEGNENPAESSLLPEYERIDPESLKQERQARKSVSFVKIAIPLLLLVIAFVYLGSLAYEWYTNSSGNGNAVTLEQIQEMQTANSDGYPETDVTVLRTENGNSTLQNAPATAMTTDTDSVAITEKTEKNQSEIKNEPVTVPLPATRENTPQAQKPVVATSGKIIDKVKIGTGDRLTLISLKYYGHKFFWVYLYEANKDVIKNPNNVPVGTTIKIPAPEVYGIDAHDKASVARAAALQAKIIEGKD